MRSQRRPAVTVSHIAITTSDPNGTGDRATETFETVIEDAIFQPGRLGENTAGDQVPVEDLAIWDLPGVHEVSAKDLIVHGSTEWQVEGGGRVWLDRTRCPVLQTRSS